MPTTNPQNAPVAGATRCSAGRLARSSLWRSSHARRAASGARRARRRRRPQPPAAAAARRRRLNRRRPPRSAWVSTVVAADLDGERLLPHFVNYYHQLGVTYRRFLLLVHHDPAAPRAGLELALGTCQAYALECRVWEGRYDPQEAYARQLAFLNDHVFDPFDWVIPAELDELQEWPSKQ